jgi:hypothetical protein
LKDSPQPIPCVQRREHQVGGKSHAINGTPLYRIHPGIIAEDKQHHETGDAQKEEARTNWILF